MGGVCIFVTSITSILPDILYQAQIKYLKLFELLFEPRVYSLMHTVANHNKTEHIPLDKFRLVSPRFSHLL